MLESAGRKQGGISIYLVNITREIEEDQYEEVIRSDTSLDGWWMMSSEGPGHESISKDLLMKMPFSEDEIACAGEAGSHQNLPYLKQTPQTAYFVRQTASIQCCCSRYSRYIFMHS